MRKTFTFFLSTAPYASENTHTALALAEAALARGHRVNLVAAADGVYAFLKGQKARGLPNAEERFAALIARGLKVLLCGGCLDSRRAAKEDFLEGTEAVSLKGLLRTLRESDVWLGLGA